MEYFYWGQKGPTFQPSPVWIVSMILIFVSSTPPVHGTAKVYLKLDRYENPGSIQADGTCCDGEVRNNACISGCDYSVVICLGDGEKSPCNLATFSVGALGTNEPIVNLGNVYPDGFSNPIGIPLNEWTGSVLVTITVYDVDTRERQLVDKIQFYHNMITPGRGRSPFLNMTSMTISGSRQINPSKLTLEVTTRCDVYYYSDSCSVNCVPSDDCSGHYECNRTTGERICRSGWGGPQCDQPLDANLTCPATTCSHRGTCFTTDKSYYCCCHEGYEGEHCEKDINECISSPCQHGGYCVQESAPGFRCDCNGRYKGEFCETAKTCEDNPCWNGGKCLNFTQTFQCDCERTTYRGEFCEISTSTAPSVTPIQTKKCHGNYYGPDCLTYCRATDDCSGHFTCDPRTGHRVCLPGWSQESNCTIRNTTSPGEATCSCQNGGQCFNGSCCCPVEYTGNRCQDKALFCPNKPCLNGGTCFEKDSEFWCICPEMFTGETCETMMYPNRNCKQDYYGPQCEQFCKPSYQCGSAAGQYYCNELTGQRICMFGWLGPMCDQRDPNANHAVPCPKSICRNGGACFNSTCCCSPGYTGSLCHIEILECESNPCMNGAACTDLINGYLCTCKEGFTGTNCEFEQKNPVPKNETEEYGDPCEDVTCLNGGTCLTTGKKDFVCMCPGERMVGLFCETEVSPRSPNPYCPMHYYGSNCSVNCVEENSAKGHYLCDSSDGSKICRCGWKGVNCTERAIPVVVDPECPVLGTGCKHNGACFNGTCLCPYPYSGKFCEEEKLACSYLPCGLFGECLDIPSGYICQCSPGYTGKNCNFLDDRSGAELTMSFLLSSETDTLLNPSASVITKSQAWSTDSLPTQTATTFYPYETSSRRASQLEGSASLSGSQILSSLSGSQITASISGSQIALSELVRKTDSAFSSTVATQSIQSQQIATGQTMLTASANWNTLSGSPDIATGASRASVGDISQLSTRSTTVAAIYLSGSTDSMHAMTESQRVYPSVRSSLEPFSADIRASETIYASASSSIKSSDSLNIIPGSYFITSASASGLATAPINSLQPFTIKEDIASIKTAPAYTLGSQITPSATSPLSISSETASAISCGSGVCFNGGLCQSSPTGLFCKCPRENMGQFCEIMDTARLSATLSGFATASINTISPLATNTGDGFSLSRNVLSPSVESRITPFATLPLSMTSETVSATSCGGFICYNGGVCQFSPTGTTCKCPKENMGEFCEIMGTMTGTAFSGIATAFLNTLQPIVTIKEDMSGVSITVLSSGLGSQITPFATLPMTMSSETASVTFCGSIVCLNGGECQSSPNGLTCKCPRENMGQFCEIMDTSRSTAPVFVSATPSLNTLIPYTTGKESSSGIKTAQTASMGSQITPFATLPLSMSSETASTSICGNNIVCFNGGVCQSLPTGITCKCPRENMGQFCEIMDTTRSTATGLAASSLNTLQPLTTNKDDMLSVSKTVLSPSLASQITPFATLLLSTTPEPVSTTSCGSYVCFNGGVCDSSPMGRPCKCPRENMGQFCEVLDRAIEFTTNTFSFPSMSYSLTTFPKLQDSTVQSSIAQQSSTIGMTISGMMQVVSQTDSNVLLGSMDATATVYPATMSASHTPSDMPTILPSQSTGSASATDLLVQLFSTAGQYQMSSQTPFLTGALHTATASVPIYGRSFSLQQPQGGFTELSGFPSMSAQSSAELSIKSPASQLGVSYTISPDSYRDTQSTMPSGSSQPSASVYPKASELVLKSMTSIDVRSLTATASIDTISMSSSTSSNTQSLLLDMSSYPLKSDAGHASDSVMHSTSALHPLMSATNTYMIPLATTPTLNSLFASSASVSHIQYQSLSQSDYYKQTLLPSLSGALPASRYPISATILSGSATAYVPEQTAASAYFSAATLSGPLASTETLQKPSMTAYQFAATDRYTASFIDKSLFTAQRVSTIPIDSSLPSTLYAQVLSTSQIYSTVSTAYDQRFATIPLDASMSMPYSQRPSAIPVDSSLTTLSAQFLPTARFDSSMSSSISLYSQRPSTSMLISMGYSTLGLPVSTYVSVNPTASTLQQISSSPTAFRTEALTASVPSSYTSMSSSVLATTPSPGSTSKPGKPITGEIYIINRISDLKLLIQLIQTAIVSAFQPGKPCCFTIVVDDSDKYFDDLWNPLVRIEYTFTPPSGDLDLVMIRGVMLTELDSLLIATDVFIDKDNRVYRGLPHGPEVIFSLDITGEVVMAIYAKISSVIDETWSGNNPGCGCRYRSQIVYGQRSVGRYGTLVTRIYYVMYKNDILQLTDTREAPSAEYIVSTFNSRRDVYGIYRQSQVMSYLHAYQAVVNAAIKLTSQRGLQAAAVLRNQWQRYLNNSQCRGSTCNVSVSYVRPDVLYSDVSPEAVLTSLSYFVYLNGVLIKPASYRGPTALEIGGLFSPCTCQRRASHSFFVYGEVPYFTLSTIINEMIPGEKQATILSREYYYDIYGALVTKVFFRPSVFGSWVPPKSNNSFKNVFAIRNLKVLEDGMPLKQQYKIVLHGELTTQSVEPIQITLKDAWCSNNRDIAPEDLSTYVIKLDAANFTTSTGSQVTVIHYVVVVDQTDASLTIAEEPAVDSIAEAFNRTSGGKLVVCACPVSKQQSISCTGNLNAANSTQLDLVKKTLEDAWRDANKDYSGNITVNIRNITTNQTRDKEQTIVFSVALDGGQPGVRDLDLLPPSGSSLQMRFTDSESFVALVQETGSQTRTGQNDEFPWYIPVAVVLALLLAFVTIFVFICIFRGRRKGSKEIDNNPDDFREDNYDKEHFTMEPVAFDNEAFRNLEMKSQAYEMHTDQSDYGPF